MRKVRVYTSSELEPGQTVELAGSAARHIGQVLRKRAGDKLVLFNGRGGEYAGSISDVRKALVVVDIGTKSTPMVDSSLQLSLWHGLCRSSRMDSVVQKATEMGVSCIQPVLTERGIVKLGGEKAQKRLDHWRNIAISACEQSGRNLLPEIRAPLTLASCAAQLDVNACAILLNPEGSQRLDAVIKTSQPTILLTGPEGGFSNAEIATAAGAGFISVALGPRIMRTETAPIVGLGLIQYLVGDLTDQQTT